MVKIQLSKHFVFLLLFMLFGFQAAYSQEQKVNVNFKNASLRDVFSVIEKQSTYRFSYRNAVIDVRKDITFIQSNMSVAELLNSILTPRNLEFKIVSNKMIVVSEKAVKPVGKLKPISGVVTSNTGETIIGASIIVAGTNTGTITDIDGKFSMQVPVDGKLNVRYVGYTETSIKIDDKNIYSIVLNEDTKILDEVVVVGYGTQRRQAVTGAVTTAKLESFKQTPATNILSQLKGSIAGLNIEGTTYAGDDPTFSIRGQNSISAGQTPLIVVDGAIFKGSISDISPNDIESFTVLKDMSAAAVYGSRSANGVILIETKKGKGEGKPIFDVQLNYGFLSQMQKKDLFGPQEYLQRIVDLRRQTGITDAAMDNVDLYMTAMERENYLATPDHKPTLPDPLSPFLQPAYDKTINFSVSNRTDKSNYFISTNLLERHGVMRNDNYKQLTGRINISSKLTDWFTLGVNSFYSIRDKSGSKTNNVYGLSPWASLYDENGNLNPFPQTTTSFPNPLTYYATSQMSLANNLNAVITAKVDVPWVKGLSYSLNFSNTLRWNKGSSFYDENTFAGKPLLGTGSRNYNDTYNLLVDNIVHYSRLFNKLHSVDVTLLYSMEKSDSWDMSSEAQNFDNTVLGDYFLEAGQIQTVATGGGGTYALGMMARGTYTFADKYSITGTIRRDGYSGFSENKKWGVFPSLGLNWNITKENFMKEVKPINNLAIRVSYGSNGNQSIDAYSTLARVGSDRYYYSGDETYSFAKFISKFANPDLGWESTTGLNAGIDFSILKNRISGAVDGYMTNTNNLIFNLNLPAASGKTTILSNIGEVANKGIELQLSTWNIKQKNFNWKTDFSFSLNRNEIVTLLGRDDNKDGKEDDLINEGYFIGNSLGTIYSYKILGIWQEEDVVSGEIMAGQVPGSYKIEDLDGDGKITSDKDRQFLGNTKENFRWSMTNTFQYKDFQLMVYLYSIWGGNGYYSTLNNNPIQGTYAYNPEINSTKFEYWTPENPNAYFMGVANGAIYRTTASRIMDRSFIKLQKISLSYDLTRIVKPIGFTKVLASVSADNLFTWAPYWLGLDPETGAGIKDTAIPSLRTVMFSINVGF